MEDIELKNIWQSYDRKMAQAEILNAQSWALNLRCFENMQHLKASSKLKSLARFKTGAVVLGIVWTLFLGILVWGNRFQNPYFSISISMLLLFSVYAIVIYTRHIVLINRIDYEGSVIDTQKKLAQLQSSTFTSTAIMWLQMPFYATWFWNSEWINSGHGFWTVAFPITLLFASLALYLYKNINAQNMHKKWVKTLMMMGPEYSNVVKAVEFMEEIEAFKKDLI